MSRLAAISLLAGAGLAVMGAGALSLAVRVLLDERHLAEQLHTRRAHEPMGYTIADDVGRGRAW